MTVRAEGNTLEVLANGQHVGTLSREARTMRLGFEYDPQWQAEPDAFPVSLAMPLVGSAYGDPVVRTVLSGVLPDRRLTLEAIAREQHVSPDDPFALLSVLGEDCAGAMQYVRPERVATLMKPSSRRDIRWLSEPELAERLRALETPAASGRLQGDEGYFSLAGQQPKSALLLDSDNGRWGIPHGREPTTHILKPAIGKDVRFLVAEHLSLAIAREVGLAAAESFVVRAEDQVALAVVRYDRQRVDRTWVRIHQEDVCQALAMPPQLKYEKSQGPGIAAIVDLIQTHSAAPQVDVVRFLQAIALNWVIVGTDAHARNYSMLIGNGGTARLAPLYDLASALDMVDESRLHTVNLAMQIGGSYTAVKIRRDQWAQLAIDLDRDPVELRDHVRALVERLPGAVARAAAAARRAADVPDRLVDSLEGKLVKRAARCARVL